MAVPTPAQLITAVTKREWDTVRKYVADGADINGKIQNHLTPLLNAINGNMLDGVALLLELGADPNQPHDNRKPLSAAINQENPAIIKLLLDHDADPNMRPFGTGNTPLIDALHYPNIEIAKTLLDYGADPNLKIFWCPLTAAATKLDEKGAMVELLLEYGSKADFHKMKEAYNSGFISQENYHKTLRIVSGWPHKRTIKTPTYGGKNTLKKRSNNKQKALRKYIRKGFGQ